MPNHRRIDNATHENLNLAEGFHIMVLRHEVQTDQDPEPLVFDQYNLERDNGSFVGAHRRANVINGETVVAQENAALTE